MTNLNQTGINLQILLREQFRHAKLWWNIAAITQLIIVAIGSVTIFANVLSTTSALLVPCLTIISVLCRWYSDRLKGTAESLLRKIEFSNGLAWPITGRELSDILPNISSSIKRRAKNGTSSTTYFASEQLPSVQRLLESLEESAWWTKHQAQRMSIYVAVLSAVVMFLAITALIVSIQATLSQTTLINISKVVTAVIAFAFSGGYVRLAFDYHKYAREAWRAEDHACIMQKETQLPDVQAIKLLHEYQIARAGAPMLPDWLWSLMQRELNDLWIQHRKRSVGGNS